MKILVLCEGDAETRDSWSGISKSVVDHLRLAGHQVRTGDVDLHGVRRLLAAARTFSADRRRWWVRYHLGVLPFEWRSRRAERAISRSSGWTELILQFGATFEPRGRGETPYALYCDSNIAFARRGAETGFSDAAVLTRDELKRVWQRERRVYEGAIRIFTISEVLAESFRGEFGIPEDRVVPVYAGPNLDPSRVPGVESTDRESAPPTVLFVGRQFERKGGMLLLDAFARVTEKIPDARLVVAGPDDVPTTDPRVINLGFLDKDVPGERTRLERAYVEADVFCMPTRFEAFGVVFLEAMLYGLPCVGPDAWAVPEMIVDGETGIVVPPEDPGALADALSTLLRNPSLGQRMGEAGRARALSEFTWRAVIERMQNALVKST